MPRSEEQDDLQPLYSTVVDALASVAALQGEVGITLLPDKEGGPELRLSYRQLQRDALRISESLAALGVAAGDRVLIVLPTSLEFVACFFATQFLRAIPVPVYPPVGLRLKAGLERLGRVATRAKSRLCITNARLRPLLGDLLLRAPVVTRLAIAEELAGGTEPNRVLRSSSDDAALIQFTSGSTGNPKGVLVSQSNVIANIHGCGQSLRVSRDDVMVSWCPLYHDMGLIGVLLFSVYWHLPLVLLSPLAFLARPARWLWAIHRHRGTLSPSPNFGYDMCVSRVTDEERAGLDLTSWRSAMNGAEQVNHRTLVDFERTYRPYGFRLGSFCPVYGLAEASVAVTFSPQGAGARCETIDRAELSNGRAVPSSGERSLSVVSVGGALPGHQVAVVDDGGAPLPERHVGNVVFKGKSVMTGYYDDEEATAQVLRKGWLWTGDLGYFAEQELYLTGRAKDLLIIRGRNIYPEDLERTAERVPGVRPGSAFAFSIDGASGETERAVLVAETRVRDKRERDALAVLIRERVSELCEIELHDVVLADRGSVPKTTSGKRQRALCRRLYLAGQLRPARTGQLAIGLIVARAQLGLLLRRLARPFREALESATVRHKKDA